MNLRNIIKRKFCKHKGERVWTLTTDDTITYMCKNCREIVHEDITAYQQYINALKKLQHIPKPITYDEVID